MGADPARRRRRPVDAGNRPRPIAITAATFRAFRPSFPICGASGVTAIYLNPVFRSPSTPQVRHHGLPCTWTTAFGQAIDPAEIAGETGRSGHLEMDQVRQGPARFRGRGASSGLQSGSRWRVQSRRRTVRSLSGRRSRTARNPNTRTGSPSASGIPVTWISFGGRAGGNMPELKKDPVTGLAPGSARLRPQHHEAMAGA